MAAVPPGEGSTSHSPQSVPRKVYRARYDRMIMGVCGGIGKYLSIDPTIVRVIWILAVFIGGSGILAYIIAAFLIPNEPEGAAEAAPRQKSNRSRLGALAGILLILFGILLMFNTISWFKFQQALPFFSFWHFQFSIFGPLILITLGALFLLMYFKKEIPCLTGKIPLQRSRSDKKIFGVCGGIGTYFKIDPTIVRIFWVFFTLATGFATGIVLYVIFTVLLPEESVVNVRHTPPKAGEE